MQVSERVKGIAASQSLAMAARAKAMKAAGVDELNTVNRFHGRNVRMPEQNRIAMLFLRKVQHIETSGYGMPVQQQESLVMPLDRFR